jgi:aspartate aminotransferase-like enzyme
VRHDIRALADLTRSRAETVLVVDAITGVGVFDIPMDAWGLDVVVTGSQKALMLPPGLAFLSLSEKAWKMAATSTSPKYYFNLSKERKSLAKHTTAFTPAVSLIIGLAESLRMIREEGLEKVFARHARLARAAREAMLALGLELYAPDAPSEALTAIRVPEGIDGKPFVKHLASKYGVTIAGGQDRAAGKIFRIAHLGYADTFDLLAAVAAVEMGLKDLGYQVAMGKGVATAQKILAE